MHESPWQEIKKYFEFIGLMLLAKKYFLRRMLGLAIAILTKLLEHLM